MRAFDSAWGDEDDPPQGGRPRGISAFDSAWGDDEADRRRAREVSRAAQRRREVSAVEDFAGGAQIGLAKTGTGLVRGAGWVADKVTGGRAGRGMQRWADETEREVEEDVGARYGDERYDTGTAGTAGEVTGRLAGEVAVSLAGGAAINRGMRAVANAPRAGRIGEAAGAYNRVIGKLDKLGPVGRATANVAPFAPIDFLSGAGSPQIDEETGDERGFVLPGRAGSGAENVMMSFVPTVAFEGARDLVKARRASSAADSRFADAAARQGREKAGMALVDEEKAKAARASADRFANKRIPKDRQLGPGAYTTSPSTPESELESLLAELRAQRGGAEAPPPPREAPFETGTATESSIEPQRALPAGRYDMPGASFQTRDVPEMRPERLLPGVRGTDQYSRAASPASGEAGRYTEGPGIPSPAARPPQGMPSRATDADVDTYRAARDEGAPMLRRQDPSATGNFRTGEAGGVESIEEYRARLRRLIERRAENAPTGELGDFFEQKGRGLTEARTAEGAPVRDLSNVPDDELDDELIKLAERESHYEGMIAHREDPRWAQMRAMPDEERAGIRRITDAERVSGITNQGGKKPRKNQKVRKMEDLPEGGSLYDADELDDINKMDTEHNAGALERQNIESLRARIEAEKARRAGGSGGDRTGGARADLMAPLGGSVIGGAAGGMVGDTPEERFRNMAIGAAAGAGVGAITARVLGEAPSMRARGGVTRGTQGARDGYVGDPSYMMGSRPFPREVAPDELARLSEVERRSREAKAGPIRIPAKPGTQSEVLRGEEAVRAAGVSADPLARIRSERMPSDIARANRVGAVGDVETVGGSGSPMMKGKKSTVLSADEANGLSDEQWDDLHGELSDALDYGDARGGRRAYEVQDEVDQIMNKLREKRGSFTSDLATAIRAAGREYGWSSATQKRVSWALNDSPDALRKAAGLDAPKVATEEAPRKFSSTQLDLPEETAKQIHDLSATIPDDALAAGGRETTPHITVKYGLHGDDAEEVRALLADQPPIKVKFGKTSVFENVEGGTADAVKVDVESDELRALNKKIADALETTDTHPDYIPHATVAYVKPGMGKDYAGNAALDGQEITLDRLTFSGKDGNLVEIPLGGKSSGNRTGSVAGELLAATGGAAIGGKGDEDDTAGERVMKAAVGAIAGVAGVKAVKAFGKRVPKDAANDLGTDAKLVSGKPNRREKPGDLFNKSVQRSLDPQGYELWKNEEARAIKAGYKKTPVTDSSLREAAKIADIDAISLKDVGDLKESELIATANRIKQDRTEYASLIERMEKGETSKEAWSELQQDMDDVLGRLVVSDTRLNKAGSEAGRRLRVFKMIMGDAAKAGKPDAIFKTARQVLGVKELGDDVLDALTGVMKKPGLTPKQRELELARAISGFMDKGPVEAMLDIRRWGMLTAPATHAVNLTGNVAELAADKMIVTPIAAAIDRVISKLSPNGQRSITGTGRYSGYGKGFTDEIKKIKANYKDYFKGVDPEEPLAGLRMQRTNYVKAFGLDKEGAWRAALKPGAQRLQQAGDIVYGMMHVTDRPFMEAALQSSLAERSALRAAREGVTPGTPAFKKRVAELMKSENVTEVDATMAVMEAMDATFKTPTGMNAAANMWTQSDNVFAKTAGYGLKYAVPFMNTPMNLIKKGLEATPGIGQMFTEVEARFLKKRLQKMGASKEEIAREMQRKRVTGAAKQLGTGAGLVGLGYLWTKMGMLRGEYVEPRAQSEAERDESGVARLTGQGPLTLKIGKTAHSLSGFTQFAPLLAMGHAFAQSDMEQAADPSNQVSLGKRAWDIASTTAKSTYRTVREMPMLQGVKNLTELDQGAGKAAGREAASMIPFSSGIASAARVMDPEEAREVKSFGDAVAERIPGLRETLPSKVTPMGKVRENAGPVKELLSPTRPQRVIDGPVEKELIRLKVTPGMPRQLSGEDRKAYVERVKVEGTEIDEVLSRMIASPDYSQWPPPEWVERAVENSDIWKDPTDKRPAEDKAKDALVRYMIRFVRTEQGKRRMPNGGTP